MYILVQIRKLLDMRAPGEHDHYRALRFFCDWALHTNLTNKTAQNVLRLFDKAHSILSDKQKLPQDLRGQIEDIIHLRRFENELGCFLREYNLPITILAEPWTSFLRFYARVVQDSPLVVTGRDLENIASVTVTIEDAVRPMVYEGVESWMFRIKWLSEGKDGTRGSHESYNSIESGSTPT